MLLVAIQNFKSIFILFKLLVYAKINNFKGTNRNLREIKNKGLTNKEKLLEIALETEDY